MSNIVSFNYLPIDIQFKNINKNISNIYILQENTNNLICKLNILKCNEIFYIKKSLINITEEELRNIISQEKWRIRIIQDEDACHYIHISKMFDNNNQTYLQFISEGGCGENMILRFQYDENKVIELLQQIIYFLKNSNLKENDA